MSAKRAGTKRARGGECCSHIEGNGHSVNQLRLLLLKVLPEGVQSAAAGSHQQHVCISCQKSAKDGFQEAGPDCDHTISLDTHRLELHCRCCKDFVYLETFDEALLLACQQWMQQKRSNGHCGIPSNDPGPALLSKRQRLIPAPSPEPGCNRSSNTSSQTAVEAAVGAANADQQQVAALAAATAGSWEACVAPDGFPLGLRGLNNLGNTCFMNSVLQVMLHAPLLRSFYLGEGHDPGTCRLTARDKPCLSCQMDTVFGEVYSGNRQPFSPAEFLYQWWRFADSLAGYQQQDAHEFYLSLLEGMSGSMVPLGPPPPTAAAANGNRESPGSRQPGSRARQQQQPQQQGAVVQSSNPVQGVDAGCLNVLGGSMAGFGPGMVPAGALQQPGLQPRQPHPSLTAPAPRQHHMDPLPLQLDQPQQQAGSSGLNGWPLDPQSQQQQQSGPGGDLSGYETPISSGATPEPEGDTEAASRPPDEGPTAALVDLVFSGLLRSDVRCCACGHTSTAHDPFRDISLDLHVPRPPRLPPAEPHHRPPAKAAVAVAAGAAAGAQAGREQDAGQAGGPDQLAGAQVSPAVAAAAKRLGISGPLVTAVEVDLLGLREVTPPLVVGMTPSPTPPPSDLLIEYWDNTDNERDTAAGGSRLLSGRDAREASQATSMSRPLSAATGLEEGDGEGGLSTALSREVGEEDEVMQQQDEAGTAEGPGSSQEPPAAPTDGVVSGKDAVSAGTQGASLTPEPMSVGGEESEESEKSPGASEVGGPVASQSSQQVGALRTAGQREATPELDAPAGGTVGARGAAAQQLQRRGAADMRESTPQSQATQPSQQQQQGFEPPQQQGMPQQPSNAASYPNASAGQEQHAAADGGAVDVAAAPANAAGVSSIVRGVSGGLSQLVKGPMSAIKQTAATAIKLLPGWGGTTGDDQQQPGEQQFQQRYGTQLDQQQQQPQQQQESQDQQQQLGSFPSGYSDVSGMGQAVQYDMAAMQQYAQHSYPDQMQQYDPQQQQMYIDSWGMQPYDSTGYDPAAYSGDWMQHSQMYNSGYVDPAAAAAAPVGAVPGPGAGAGGKSSKGAAAPKPRQTRCGKCKYCINRHLKKGCEANKKLREEAKAAAKAQARLAAEDRAAVQRAAAQRAAQNIAATAAAENDPAAAAAQPVFGAPDPAAAAAGAGAGAGATQPTHPLGGMQVHPGATAGAGWAHPGGAHPGSMYQQHHQQFNPADYYAQQQQTQLQVQPGPTAGAAAGFPPARQQHTAPPAVKPAKPKSAVASAVKVSERLVSAALTAGLLKKRDGKGRFYRKEHLQAWAKLLYERGQITTHGLPAVTPEAAAAAAATQDAAMAAGTAEWPLPPWMQPQEPAGGQGAGVGGAGAPVRPASAPPALKASGQASKASASVKKGSSTGVSMGKKAQPAVLRMNDLTLAGCLRRYVRPERLGSAAHWRCSACGSSTAALKQLSFRRLPLVLCFHVKRFEHGGAAQRPRKLDIPMRFPLHGLDMSPFTTSHMLRDLSHAQHCKPAPGPDSTAGVSQAGGSAGAGAGAAGAGAGTVGADGEDVPSFQQSCLYELFGVVSHWGDMSSGHYVSYIKCDGAWYLINDPWVVAVSEADVAGVQAYMLFYAQEYLFGAGSSGELAEHQRKQRAEAAAAVVAAAAAASAKVKPECAVKTEAGVGSGLGVKPDPGATAGAGGGGSDAGQPVNGPAAGGGASGVKVEPGL